MDERAAAPIPRPLPPMLGEGEIFGRDCGAEGAAVEAGRQKHRGGVGLGRVLVIAGVGALLVGFAAFAANSVVQSDQPIVRTMCMDTSCSQPMSVDGATAHPAAPKHAKSAPERLVQKILYICHIR
ncbi:MAG TPA: hypothetical protein VKV26_06125 [Dehalococcoidia bacterium]|nr:hypothetical protein [Dehalococcoidia bacterium]